MNRQSPIDVLRASGVEYSLIDHAPIRGYDDVLRTLSVSPGHLLKTMVFRTAEGQFILAALPALSRVSYRLLSKVVNVPRARLRQATPDELLLLLMEPGGASPVCGVGDVIVVFDSAVVSMGRAYCGSGTATQTIVIDLSVLLKLVRPIVAPIAA